MKTLLIIETINNLGASEGVALENALNLTQDYIDQRERYSKQYLRIKPCQKVYTESKFLKLLGKDVDYLHISAHGDKSGLEIGRKEKRGKTIKRGLTITPNKIRTEVNVKASRVFVSACNAGHKELAKAFFSDGRDGIYLGPCRKVNFDEAFLISLSFHRGLFDKSLEAGRDIVLKDGRLFDRGTYYYFRSPQDL